MSSLISLSIVAIFLNSFSVISCISFLLNPLLWVYLLLGDSWYTDNHVSCVFLCWDLLISWYFSDIRIVSFKFYCVQEELGFGKDEVWLLPSRLGMSLGSLTYPEYVILIQGLSNGRHHSQGRRLITDYYGRSSHTWWVRLVQRQNISHCKTTTPWL